jgi:hypothetical protein
MATISRTGIADGSAIQAEHIIRIIDTLDGTATTDIIATGSFTGSFDGIHTGTIASASYAVTDDLPEWLEAKITLAAEYMNAVKDWLTYNKAGDSMSAMKMQLKALVPERIEKVDDKWVVYPSKGGKRLGTHDTKKAALKQLAAIEINKGNR